VAEIQRQRGTFPSLLPDVAIPLAGWLLVSVGSMGHPTPVFGLFGWPSFPILADMPAALASLSRGLRHGERMAPWSAIVLIRCMSRRAVSPVRAARPSAGAHDVDKANGRPNPGGACGHSDGGPIATKS